MPRGSREGKMKKLDQNQSHICDHDFKHHVRKGRGYYVCQKCGKDITVLLVMLAKVERKGKR
jgi:ribosomal protein L37AE/L43A